MTEQLLPTLPDAVAYSETLRQAVMDANAFSVVELFAQVKVGDVFLICLALGLIGGLTVIGYTRATTLPVTHRAILIAAGLTLAAAAMVPTISLPPLTLLLIVSCGLLALTLEAIHQVRAIAAYAHIRTGQAQ